LLFAFGGLAIAPVSLGGCAVGLISFGGFTIGALALGGLSVGMWSFGGMAFGWESYGGCAIAWSGAIGGVAIARDFALGGIAQAAQANNETAQTYLSSLAFFRNATIFIRYYAWLNLIWVIPMIYWWRAIARARKVRGTE
jgi:hypothetical protein